MRGKQILLAAFVFVIGQVLINSAWADLVGRWKFDEGSGTTVYDSSGNGNNGTLVGGATWAVGRFGGGLELDGTSGYVSVPDFELTTDSITFAIWLNGWKGGDWAPLISSRVVGQCEMIFGDDNTLRYVWNNDSAATWGWTGGPVIPQDTWAMLAVTINPERAVAYVYTDAEGLTQSTNAIAHIEETVGALQIGYSYGNRFIRGIIDEAAIYDHALSEDEILAVIKGEGIPKAFGPNPPDQTILSDTWVNLSWRPGDFAVSHDVYLGDSFNTVNNATPTSETFRGNQTSTFYVAGFPGFAYPDGLVPGTTYYWRIDEVNQAEPNSPWKGDIWSFSIPPKTAYNPEPADGAEFVALDSTFSWTPGYGAKLHTVYLATDYDAVDNAAGGLPQGIANYKPAAPLEEEKVYYWRVDEFDAVATYKGAIWGFTTPGAAGNPSPANRATGVQMKATLSWTPAATAVSHDVYFGTDKDAVMDATIASPEYKGNKASGAESYDPGKLAWNGDYYWRVDAVYSTGTVKGLVWSFTTADFISVDDFESYNDIDPPDPNSNRIFDIWIDGFGTTDNGALVGNDLPPYAEQTTVHSGGQSMPYRYDNANKTSEATLTLVYPRDWTEEGVAKLSLWVRGASANSAERMYITLNGNAIVYNDDTAATQKGGWNQWVIDLTAFTGVNLTNVDTITIGIGTKGSPAAGGTGTMYFDDIRLIR